MKKLKIMFVSGLAVLALCFGFFLPVGYVSADEVSQTPKISAEIGAESHESVESVETPAESENVENLDDYTASYYAQTGETEGVRLDFIDETNVKCVMFVEGVEVGTLNATYQRVDNIVDIYVFDEWFGAFRLNGDGTASDVSWWEDYNKETPDENPPVLDEDGGFDFWAVFKDSKTWIIVTLGAIAGLFLAAVFAAILGHFRNKGVINTEKNVETIAAKAAADAVKGIVGNSINLDISAEVNKAVEKFMYGIKNELDSTFDMAKNTEILTAEIAHALSKSRVLTKEEQNQLHADADAVMAHAQKGGAGIKAPAAVVVKEDQATAQKTDTKTNAKPENGYTLNFGGV